MDQTLSDLLRLQSLRFTPSCAGGQTDSRLDRSRDWIVKQALSAWIAQEEERDKLTQQALADVGAGRIVDHQAWAESLGTDQPLPLPR